MKVIQLNKLFKSKRASILLVTLSTTVLLFFFSVAIFNIYRNASYLRIRESRYMKANWASRSVLALLANKISQSSDIFISLQEHKKLSWGEFQKTLTVNEKKALSNLGDLSGELSISPGVDPGMYQLQYQSKIRGFRKKTSLLIKRFSYSDYMFYFNKNIQLIAVEQPLRFYGPIYVAGDLELGAYGGNISFYKPEIIKYPLLYSEGRIKEFPGINNASGIQFFSGNLNAGSMNPVSSLDKSSNWQLAVNSRKKDWFIDSARGAQKIPFLSYKDLLRYLEKKKKTLRQYSLGRRGNFSEVVIVNPKLVKKLFIGRGTGAKSYFNHSAGYVPKRVYVNRILTKNPNDQKIHPIAALDNSEKADQEVSYGTVQFKKDIIPLELPDDAFRTYGVIRLGGRGWSRVARDLSIREIYLNGKTVNERLKSNLYFYDSTKKELVFLTTLFKQYYKVLDNVKPDGVKRDFLMLDGFPAYGYVNGKKWNMTAIKGRIIFDNPPPAGSQIAILIKKPDLYVRKEVPLPKTGVYIDQPIHTLRVNLAQLGSGYNADPKKLPVYQFFCPVLLYGNAQRPLVIVSSGDVYLENINFYGPPHAVTVIAQGVVWAHNKDTSPLTIQHVWIYSAGDQLFSVFDRPLKKDQKHVFEGTAMFAGTLTNAFVEKSLENSYLYTIEYFENWNYVYDVLFQKQNKAPLGVPVTFTMEGISW